jgi:Do/DeqQ family serine protease
MRLNCYLVKTILAQILRPMSSRKQFFFSLFLASLAGGIVAVLLMKFLGFNRSYRSFEERQGLQMAFLASDSITVPEGINFVYAANSVSPAVVHIKTSFRSRKSSSSDEELDDMFRQFHGRGYQAPRSSSGSGVIISDDGYIATNNHVIDKAEQIEVILPNKSSYRARLVGTDPSTDLALLKIDAQDLPFARYGDSDKLRIGEWVLAIGNPFDLTSTVTAGIISAKARSINIIRANDGLQVEAFLQTDAVVNPGNSGGALVNLRGELIGINTAIASETGSYQGYSFAVPVSLVKKVMNDLLNHGEVQRALLGIQIEDIDAKLAEHLGLDGVQGVYIGGVNPKSGAEEAGLQEGDVLISINGVAINSVAQLQATIAARQPDDVVKVAYKRGSSEKNTEVRLKGKSATVEMVRRPKARNPQRWGLEFEILEEEALSTLKIKGGVKVKSVNSKKMIQAGVRPGFIITHISQNGKRRTVLSLEEAFAIFDGLENNSGIYLEGIYENGDRAYYPVGW